MTLPGRGHSLTQKQPLGHVMGSTRLTGRTILVVENESLIALSLSELFEEEGATVSIANTPKTSVAR